MEYINIKERIIVSLFPLIIGAICSSMGFWSIDQDYFFVKLIIILALNIIFIILLNMKFKDKNYEFSINKDTLRITFMQISAIIFSALCSAMGDWNNTQNYFILKVLLIITILILYLSITVYCIKKDFDTIKQFKQYQKILQMKQNMIIMIDNFEKEVILNMRSIRSDNKVKESQIKLLEFYDSLCSLILKLLFDLEDNQIDVEVKYMRRIDKSTVQILGESTSSKNYRNVINIYKHPNYFTEFFKCNNKNVKIFTSEDIEKRIIDSKRKITTYIGFPLIINDILYGLLSITYTSPNIFENNMELCSNILDEINPLFNQLPLLDAYYDLLSYCNSINQTK